MSEDKNTGGPAFPYEDVLKRINGKVTSWDVYSGMSLRDYFAAKALEGLLAAGLGVRTSTDTQSYIPADMATVSYFYADAMLAERTKPQ
ncbi:MAG: hypothetical protein KGJ90_02440 [Patescibacteria group bacterium]|nr:hypothetical protein [Patescibacteria group bacterium]